MESDARRTHYAHFYGLAEPEGDSPVCVVVGNCQAESLRLVIDGGDLTTVRMPAVHELTRDDMPSLDRWLGRAQYLVSQPIRDDYHDLPLGHAQTASRAAAARTLIVPVIRYAGLYPWHAIVRPPRDASLVPPIAPYHDLRTLTRAAGITLPEPTAGTIRAVAEHSLDQLRRREQHHGAVVVSDLFALPTFDLVRTINHPGNPVWAALAVRVREAFGLPDTITDPGRPLLDSIHAPRSEAVIDAFGLDVPATSFWRIGGVEVGDDAVQDAHLAWYRANPDVVGAGLDRHRDVLRLLGATSA